ncbi:MAG: ribokinase [Candidatus Nephthysia bennettiae]|uniref:Ribokinase n=1 Tax=Candidatus Nephthysia bennettiae TaxID=3127016 RepID=A0A934JZS6_9BACT|nr:ribokinase [Candidatus Dormibacteraeota bacterium]MBJ7610706.1 ribokinase [Candidatus Dormibacteraeota bacterium]PZR99490.1 MAG: ribokinase [Candidatus Dormibacteraeota bacterium]
MGRVAVLGSLNMDLVVQTKELPLAGQTVVGDRLHTLPGGKGANQAVAAARLGAEVRMVGRVGSDAHGEELIRGLVEDGVEVSAVTRDSEEPSGAALIVVAAGGQNMITLAPGANGRVGEEEVEALVRGLARGDVVVLQLEVPLQAVLSAAERARRAGARVLLNAAPSTPLAGQPPPPTDLLVVNEAEAAELAGEPVSDLAGAERAARRLAASGGAVVVTMGAAGAVLWDSEKATRVPARAVDAVDATAAGDAFVGALAMALAAGWNITDAVGLGTAAGAAAASRLGARSSLPRSADLDRLFGLDLHATRGPQP